MMNLRLKAVLIRLKAVLKRIIPHFLLKKYMSVRARLEKNIIFQVHLTYHCNLRCKSCSHFSAISENRFLDITTFENDLEHISSISYGGGGVRQIDLLGGEPLLHPQINDFLIIARKYFKKTKIILFTNGILLPKMPDAFWKICNINDIIVYISSYPIQIDFDNIKYKAKKYKVDLRYDSITADKIFGHFRMDINGKQNADENTKLCYESKNCHCLDNGKMFLCYLPACIYIFNNHFNKDIPICKDDYIDIYEAKSISEIVKRLKKPMPFCKYCDVKNRDSTEWGITKKDIAEWT